MTANRVTNSFTNYHLSSGWLMKVTRGCRNRQPAHLQSPFIFLTLSDSHSLDACQTVTNMYRISLRLYVKNQSLHASHGLTIPVKWGKRQALKYPVIFLNNNPRNRLSHRGFKHNPIM